MNSTTLNSAKHTQPSPLSSFMTPHVRHLLEKSRQKLTEIAVFHTALVVFMVLMASTASTASAASARSLDEHLPPPSPAFVAYEELLEQHFLGPLDVPNEGIILEFEGARWTLRSGRFWLQSPVLSGLFTGIAFEGDGLLQLDVPDRFELHQLRRFSREEEISRVESRVESEFSKLYLRALGPEITEPLSRLAEEHDLAGSNSVSPSLGLQKSPAWIKDRQQRWLLHHQIDADARILAATATFGERYLRADQNLQKHGWTTFSFDARQREEVELTKPVRHNQSVMKPFFSESWLRMDQISERAADGRPNSDGGGFSALSHLDLQVDLTELGRTPALGFGNSHSIEAAISGTATFLSRRDGLGALVIQLDPRATDLEVHSDAGNPLTVLRYPRGTLTNVLRNDSGIRRFVVLLDRPLRAGDEVDLEFSYELELINYAPAVSWHPNSTDFELQPVTADIEFTSRDYYDVYSTGERVASEERGDRLWSKWQVKEPTRILGFSFARFPHAAQFAWEGLPPVTIFGTTAGFLSATRIENLQRFFHDNLQCLVDSLGPPRAPELVITLIAANHSQSFEGFVQVTETIAKKGALGIAVHGTKELLAAHELAHQWWGHQVVPESDRDVWLSESLAEYSAALCVRRTVDDGERLFGNIVDAFTNETHGSTARAWNPFSRPTLTIFNSYERKRQPPISHGTRGSVSNNLYGNLTTLYRKGALVVHMADELLRVQTGDRKSFDTLLRKLAQPSATRLNTEQFQQELQRAFDTTAEVKDGPTGEGPEVDWQVLFDQWVRLPEVPTWKVSIGQAPEQTTVQIDVLQSGVAPDFVSWVPVYATFADGSTDERLITVSGPESRAIVRYEQPPERVEFNRNRAVPAKMRGQIARKFR